MFFLKSENSALLACCARYVFVLLNDPLLVRNIPRYLYSFTTSNSVLLNMNLWFPCGLPLLKIRTLFFETLTVSFHMLQYASKVEREYCRSVSFSPNITISLA